MVRSSPKFYLFLIINIHKFNSVGWSFFQSLFSVFGNSFTGACGDVIPKWIFSSASCLIIYFLHCFLSLNWNIVGFCPFVWHVGSWGDSAGGTLRMMDQVGISFVCIHHYTFMSWYFIMDLIMHFRRQRHVQWSFVVAGWDNFLLSPTFCSFSLWLTKHRSKGCKRPTECRISLLNNNNNYFCRWWIFLCHCHCPLLWWWSIKEHF